jgi:hypothetical protein
LCWGGARGVCQDVTGCHARAWPRGNSSVAPGSTARVRFRRIGRAGAGASQFWVLGFCESSRRGTHLLGLLGAAFGRHGRELRTAVGRGTLGDVRRSERSGRRACGRRFLNLTRRRSPRQTSSLKGRIDSLIGTAPVRALQLSSRFLRGARHLDRAPWPRSCHARRRRRASPPPRVAASRARRRLARGARAAACLLRRGRMTVRAGRRPRTAPSARWTPCSACPATTTKSRLSGRTVSSRTRRALPRSLPRKRPRRTAWQTPSRPADPPTTTKTKQKTTSRLDGNRGSRRARACTTRLPPLQSRRTSWLWRTCLCLSQTTRCTAPATATAATCFFV